MLKSYVDELSRVYVAIFTDAMYAFPTLKGELERSLATLQAAVVKAGIHVFCVELPLLAKHLDRCLDDGKYSFLRSYLNVKRGGRKQKGQVPWFMGELLLLIFNRDGSLKEDCNVEAIFFLRQILCGAKRTAIQCSDDNVLKEIKSFVVVDDSLPEPESFWSRTAPTMQEVSAACPGFTGSSRYRSKVDAHPRLRRELSIFLGKLDIVSGLLCSALGAYQYAEWNFRHGPGAISDADHTGNKYSWLNWSDRLEGEFPIADCGFSNWLHWGGYVSDPWLRTSRCAIGGDEPRSRLIDVLKTFTKPRLIAAEPSEHQWCQQNIWHYFCVRTYKSWISSFVAFNDQKRNQVLCLEGSQTGMLSTVDLSAASDRVSCHAVAQLFRSNIGLLRALQASRTRFIDLPQATPLNGLPSMVELRKFSTMGSACTFPVESLMFLAVTLAAVLTKYGEEPTVENILRHEGEVTIFGDDIIVPTDCRELLVEALEVLDFKVNMAKTYGGGNFRESCGVDAFRGVNVTPAYWRASYSGTPDSYTSTVDTANNFYKKFLVNTSVYLESTIRRESIIMTPVVPYDSEVCGVKSFVKPQLTAYKRTRWNWRLQRLECKVTVPTGKATSTPLTDDTALLQYFIEAPEPSSPWKGGYERCAVIKLDDSWVPLEYLGLAQPELENIAWPNGRPALTS